MLTITVQPLSQHDPPPCTLYYLANNGCKHGTECRFGHDYQLSEDDYDIVRNAARKVPCPSANRGLGVLLCFSDAFLISAYLGDICIFGEQCCYGHSCPFASKCHYMRHGKCKFAGRESLNTSLGPIQCLFRRTNSQHARRTHNVTLLRA